MGVIVSIGKHRAWLRRGEWRCADLRLERRLNEWTEEWLQSGSAPRLDDADQELAVAREMAARAGGRVMYSARTSPERTVRDFFPKRQFRLAFPDVE
ncbi:MAG: hypothetical protein WHT08_01650 [Bryobacteraceae bacterium]|jgi:hypothetical protein